MPKGLMNGYRTISFVFHKMLQQSCWTAGPVCFLDEIHTDPEIPCASPQHGGMDASAACTVPGSSNKHDCVCNSFPQIKFPSKKQIFL